jgi:hypothetical protein
MRFLLQDLHKPFNHCINQYISCIHLQSSIENILEILKQMPSIHYISLIPMIYQKCFNIMIEMIGM